MLKCRCRSDVALTHHVQAYIADKLWDGHTDCGAPVPFWANRHSRTKLEKPRTYNQPVTLSAWLEAALADAEARQLPAVRPLLENLARASATLRAADWNSDANSDASRDETPASEPHAG